MEDGPSRKLAVLLHADVVGSTGLVKRDETLAHERILDAFRRFSEAISAYNGIAREIRGDALVAEFDRAGCVFRGQPTRQCRSVCRLRTRVSVSRTLRGLTNRCEPIRSRSSQGKPLPRRNATGDGRASGSRSQPSVSTMSTVVILPSDSRTLSATWETGGSDRNTPEDIRGASNNENLRPGED